MLLQASWKINFDIRVSLARQFREHVFTFTSEHNSPEEFRNDRTRPAPFVSAPAILHAVHVANKLTPPTKNLHLHLKRLKNSVKILWSILQRSSGECPNILDTHTQTFDSFRPLGFIIFYLLGLINNQSNVLRMSHHLWRWPANHYLPTLTLLSNLMWLQITWKIFIISNYNFAKTRQPKRLLILDNCNI